MHRIDDSESENSQILEMINYDDYFSRLLFLVPQFLCLLVISFVVHGLMGREYFIFGELHLQIALSCSIANNVSQFLCYTI